jgi:hypothetical protein
MLKTISLPKTHCAPDSGDVLGAMCTVARHRLLTVTVSSCAVSHTAAVSLLGTLAVAGSAASLGRCSVVPTQCVWLTVTKCTCLLWAAHACIGMALPVQMTACTWNTGAHLQHSSHSASPNETQMSIRM